MSTLSHYFTLFVPPPKTLPSTSDSPSQNQWPDSSSMPLSTFYCCSAFSFWVILATNSADSQASYSYSPSPICSSPPTSLLPQTQSGLVFAPSQGSGEADLPLLLCTTASPVPPGTPLRSQCGPSPGDSAQGLSTALSQCEIH